MKWFQENLTISGLLIVVSLFSIFIDTSDYYDTCMCDCDIPSQDIPGIEWIGMEFISHENSVSSCSCKDFLLPRLKPNMMSMPNETCQVCSCYEIGQLECFNGRMNSYLRFSFVGLTCLFIQFLLLLIYIFSKWCNSKQNSHIYEGSESDYLTTHTVERIKPKDIKCCICRYLRMRADCFFKDN